MYSAFNHCLVISFMSKFTYDEKKLLPETGIHGNVARHFICLTKIYK